jgi:GntR family transcriptional regulator
MKPKYRMIYEDLITKLDKKIYDKGDMLPTEKELCEIYGTSRMTVSKVIQILQQEGRVNRIRGKGTFVIEPQVDKDILKLTSFSEDMMRIGKLPGARVLEYRMSFDVDDDTKEVLELDDSDFVHIIKRVRTADNEAIALDIDRISSRVGDKFNVDKLEHSLYNYFEEDLQIAIFHSDFTIKASSATKEIAKYLNIEVGDPVLYMKHITYTKKGMPFEFCQTYYRADKYSLSIRAYR